MLCASAATASASTLTVSVAGQFRSGVTDDQLAAPDALWALSFDVNSNPSAANTDALSFDAPFSDFSYTLSGSAIGVSPESIRFFDSSDGGLFTVFFGPETGFFNGMPIPEFSFSGGQAFSGTTASPTIVLGSYPVADALYSDALNYDDEGASGTVTIPAAASSTVPESSTLWSCFLALIVLALFHRWPKRIGASDAPETPSDRESCAGDHTRVCMRLMGRTTAMMLILGLGIIALANPAKAQQEAELSIVLTQPPTDTGFYLIKGQSVTITTSGTMNWFTGGCNEQCLSTPAGSSCPYTGFYAQGLPCWSLIGRVGSGPVFEVGDSLTFTASESGELFLGVNDNNYPDNTGNWTSTIYSDSPLVELEGQCACKYGDPDGVYSPSAGDPVDIASGNMFYEVRDYTTTGQHPLSFTRYYNSQSNLATLRLFAGLTFIGTGGGALGTNWRSTFDRYLLFSSDGSVTAIGADGRQVAFTLNGTAWTPNTDVDMKLSNSGSTWTLTDRDDTIETYTRFPGGTLLSNEAQLTTIRARKGYTQTMSYAANGLASVTDSYGRALTFTYVAGLLDSVETPDGLTVTYGYNAVAGRSQLTKVTYFTNPATTQTYLYEDAALPFALTGIIDEDGNRYATWTYDATARGLTSQIGNGANLTTVVYNSDGSRIVTNALGVQETYKYRYLQGVPKATQINRAATGTTAAATETITYDAHGYQASQTDWNGNKTTYVNDVHGQPTTINEAVGTAVARTTTITYLADFHLPTKIVTPELTAGFTYDSDGELLTRTLTDTTTTTAPYSTRGQTRITKNTWSNFLLASSNSPNGNTTNFTYDSSGALTGITNALAQATNITAHTGGGLPETVVDPNGITTNLTYDARQRLLTRTVITSAGPLTTTTTYDAAGNLIRTTLPDGSALTNSYDTAHRLTTITDLFHQNVDYTLDALGDRTQTNLTAVGNRIQRQHSDNFDALGRTLQDIGGVGQTTTFAYDPNGNALTVTDPLGRATSRVFDALNRLSKSTDPATGVTTVTYDPHDRRLSVTDPNGNATTYVYDSSGDLIQQLSPDSGKTIYHYDADGNLTQKVDAASNVTNNTYDALDRVLTTSYPADSTLNVAYTYDQAGHGFGIGRLTSLTDKAGSLSRSYDERGNMLTEMRVNGATTLKTVYTYDAASRIASITYPSGWTVSQTRDMMGRIWQLPVTAPLGASAGNAITNATYKPFGPLYTLTYGNGVNEARNFDLDYRVTALADAGASAVQGLTYGYDLNDNVSSIADAVTPGNSQALGYDVLNRLTSATGAYGSLGYTYDLVGNRLKQTLGAALTTYAYTAGTNRLASITSGGSAKPVSTTATGNISSIPPTTGAPLATLTYSAVNRLASVTGTALAITGIVYDAFGQRFSKTSGGTTDYFTYGQDGSLLEENDNGFPIDYVYLNGRPVAEILPSSGKIYYLHADRLGTPQGATDVGQNVVWSANYQPFGTTGLIAGSITQNLRFPGQYSDGETDFNYNGFRDYMPNLGRYLESDPIGLAGGLNPYLYANANPGSFTDPSGLLSPNIRRAAQALVCLLKLASCHPVPTAEDLQKYASPPTTAEQAAKEAIDSQQVCRAPQQISGTPPEGAAGAAGAAAGAAVLQARPRHIRCPTLGYRPANLCKCLGLGVIIQIASISI